MGTARKIVDLATRAKSRQLSPGEIQGATFTITNPGVLGTIVGMPIIPKGTSAILGTGSIDKRVVVVTDPATGEDSMAIRKRSLFSLGYDHRLVERRRLGALPVAAQGAAGGTSPRTPETDGEEETGLANAGWANRTLAVRYPGRIGYAPALELQATLVERRRRG